MNQDEQHPGHKGCITESVMVFVATGFFVGLTIGIKTLLDILFTAVVTSSGKFMLDHVEWTLPVNILVWLILTCLFYLILRKIRRHY